MAGVALPGTAPAQATAGPILTRTTTVAGNAIEPLSTGEWVAEGGTWVLDLKSIAPPAGETGVAVSWRTPTFSARARQVVFVSRLAVAQEPVPGTYEYVNEARLCVSRTCYPWTSEVNGAVPSWIGPSTLPYRVEFGHGLSIEWMDRPMRIRVEWRYRQIQRGGNYARTTFTVAAGSGAKSL